MFSNKDIKMYLHYYNVNEKMTQILLNESKSHIFKEQKNTTIYRVTVCLQNVSAHPNFAYIESE